MVELDRVSLNAGTLQQIAESGGGKYFHESSGDDILEIIETTVKWLHHRIGHSDLAVFLLVLGNRHAACSRMVVAQTGRIGVSNVVRY